MVDYSKWKDIEISDDEDETHPNIDTSSLFRWRHRARLERMEESRKCEEQLAAEKRANNEQMAALEKKLEQSKSQNATDGDVEALTKSLAELRKKEAELQERDAERQKKEKLAPWNVDTISKDGFQKTVINKKLSHTPLSLTEEEKEERTRQFIKTNEKELKHFGMLHHYEDSRKYMKEYPHLACEETANYLVIWCINLEMEGKHNLMEHVAHQTICVQYLLELAKHLECDPRSCIQEFFTKIQHADPKYKQTFDDELEQFRQRICKRAAEKLDEAIKEAEEEERQKRLGPGGLDPLEVLESLPDELKACFDSQDVQMLQDTIARMDEMDAKYHMKRCVDSGLWIPDANKAKSEAATSEQQEKEGPADQKPSEAVEEIEETK